MKRWLALLLLLSLPIGAQAQSVVQQPIPGMVWTYFGPTFGADWGLPTIGNKIDITTDLTGTFSTTDTFINKILFNTDSANAGGNNVWGLAIIDHCCTASAQGQRFLLGSRLDITGTSNAGDPLPDYVAILGNTRVSAGIAAPNAAGGVWSGNFNTELGAGATGWAELQGAEFDVTARAGSSVIRKVAISIVQSATDAVHGISTDSAIGLYNALGATAPWNNILDLDSNTTPVISSVGAIIRARGVAAFADVIRLDTGTTIDNGLNLTNAVVTNAVLLGPGASSFISGTGSAIFNGTMAGVGNLPSTFPTTLNGWALTTNFSGAEVDLWNTNNSGNGFFFRQKTGASSGTILGQIVEAGALATTGLVIRVNNTGSGLSLQGVTLGATDSGGSGFRTLRVAN